MESKSRGKESRGQATTFETERERGAEALIAEKPLLFSSLHSVRSAPAAASRPSKSNRVRGTGFEGFEGRVRGFERVRGVE